MNILGYNYTLKYSQKPEDGGMDNQFGRVHIGKQLIIIDLNAHIQQQELTVIHEILEAINFHYELSLPHEKISALETGLYQVLLSLGMDTSLLLKI